MSIGCYDSPHVDDKAAATYSVYSARPRCLFLSHLLPAATAMTWALVALPPPFSALVRRQQQTPNCTFLTAACVNLKQLARVSGVSQWSTETLSWPRTKRLERLERLDSHGGLCGRRGAAARKVTYLPRYLTSLLSDVTNDVVTLGLQYQYILILSPILALMSAMTSGTSLIS